jgi:hypothetical protein
MSSAQTDTEARADLVRRIDEIIDLLDRPLPRSERKNGWNDENRSTFLEFFRTLRGRLLDPTPLAATEQDVGIARVMDAWGITGGELVETAAGISIALRTLN